MIRFKNQGRVWMQASALYLEPWRLKEFATAYVSLRNDLPNKVQIEINWTLSSRHSVKCRSKNCKELKNGNIMLETDSHKVQRCFSKAPMVKASKLWPDKVGTYLSGIPLRTSSFTTSFVRMWTGDWRCPWVAIGWSWYQLYGPKIKYHLHVRVSKFCDSEREPSKWINIHHCLDSYCSPVQGPKYKSICHDDSVLKAATTASSLLKK